MKQRASWLLKIAIMLALLTSLLSGCGNSKVEVNYPLESVSRDGDSTSYIYRAAGQTVPVVAEQLSDQRTPQEMSVQDPERMFLVYDNELIQVQQDPEKPEDTIIEVDSDKYVARNYDSSFLQGYLTASIISNLFNSFGGGYNYGGSYRGYTTYKTYKPTIQYKKPTTQDIKQAPPLTVNKSGSIFKRGTSSSSKRSKDSGSIFNRGSSSSNGSSGTINRGSRSDSSGGGFFSPSRSSKPKSSSGSGKIRKRSRR